MMKDKNSLRPISCEDIIKLSKRTVTEWSDLYEARKIQNSGDWRDRCCGSSNSNAPRL